MMDPLPPINKVFALISQEENQRTIGTQMVNGNDLTGAPTFAFKSESMRTSIASGSKSANIKKKERSYCTHCNIHGHSIDKCYKINGYPSSYKKRSGSYNNNFSRFNPINQFSIPLRAHNEGKLNSP